ncbi:MAG TPA: histidinol-phosphate transaminase [Elusimicrobiota bacterium]|nr:histidinol-phosphate transaminase [Elusimicrobiota bacterium]
MSLLDLARPHLRGLEPYKSARSLAAGGEVFLDANESPRPLSEDAALAGMNRYPSPQPPALVREAARSYGVPAAQVVVTRGSDEGIDLLVRAFVEPGREEIVVTPPTYGVYSIAARLHGCAVREAPLNSARGFALVPARVLAAAVGPVKLVFLCRPNNPTGTGVALTDVELLAADLSGRSLVVVDEAYLEFSGAPSAAALIARLPNVVVLKTLSKAWGLAGARVGFLLAAPEIASLMQTVRAPYPISAAAARAAEAVFNVAGEEAMRASVAAILAERGRLASRLGALRGVTEVLPSEANFLIARFRDRKAAVAALSAKGILVRDRGAETGLSDAVRITVGLPAENDRLLRELERIDG